MNKTKKNWANQSHYLQVFNYLTEKKVDTDNVYHYIDLLASQGYEVMVQDLKAWLKAKGVVLDIGGFKLTEEA